MKQSYDVEKRANNMFGAKARDAVAALKLKNSDQKLNIFEQHSGAKSTMK